MLIPTLNRYPHLNFWKTVATSNAQATTFNSHNNLLFGNFAKLLDCCKLETPNLWNANESRVRTEHDTLVNLVLAVKTTRNKFL